MPAPKLSRAEALDRIAEVFRERGYDGATLRRIAEATGLGRASLYHHFPRGKEEMAEAIFSHVGAQVGRDVVGPLSGPGSVRERLERHARGVSRFYHGGGMNCLLAAMALGGGVDHFPGQIRAAMQGWIDALAATLREDGIEARDAQRRAEAAVASIQGALVVSRALGSTAPFRRVTRGLPDQLLRGA